VSNETAVLVFDNLINHKTGEQLSIKIDAALQKAHRDTSKYIGTGKLIRQAIGGGTSDSTETIITNSPKTH